MLLTKGIKYDWTTLRLVCWTGEDTVGYQLEYYFDSEGRYLGPDKDGVEPDVERRTVPAPEDA